MIMERNLFISISEKDIGDGVGSDQFDERSTENEMLLLP